MKIGFLNRGHVSWTVGSSYTRSMVEATASVCLADVEFCVIGGRDAGLPEVERITYIRSEQPHLNAGEIGRLGCGSFAQPFGLLELEPQPMARKRSRI